MNVYHQPPTLRWWSEANEEFFKAIELEMKKNKSATNIEAYVKDATLLESI